MELAVLKQELESLTHELVGLTATMKEAAGRNDQAKLDALAISVSDLQKEIASRKHEFAAGMTDFGKSVDAKELDRKRDELFIAKAVMRKEDGTLDRPAFARTIKGGDYLDVIKASGFTFDPTAPDGLVTGNGTAADNYGSDLIAPGFSKTMLDDIFLELEVASLFKRFTMPNATFTFPLVPGRITARLGKEGIAPTKDVFGTSALTFTAKKLVSNVDFTDEMDYDALIAVLPIVREKLVGGFALGQEQIAINGDDTAGATNLNGTLAADDVRMAVGGIRKYGLANGGVNINAAFSADALRALRTKMGKYGKRPSDLAYVVSMADYCKMLGFTGYQALYQYAGAVTTTGELGRVDNIPVIVSELIPGNLNAAGKYDGTTVTKGTCVLVNRNGFMWGDRKEFSLDSYRNIYTGVNSLVGSQRLDFQKVLPATAVPVAVGYNYDA